MSATTSTLALSLSTFTLAVAMLLIGPLSEVVGRTHLIHLSLFASGVVRAMAAQAPNWPAFLTLRTVEGVVLAGLPAVGMAYLREEVHDNVHARAAGLYVAGTAMGGMSGRLIAGGLAEIGGWRVAGGDRGRCTRHRRRSRHRQDPAAALTELRPCPPAPG